MAGEHLTELKPYHASLAEKDAEIVALRAELDAALARVAELEAGMREIAQDKGAFGRDPHTHANTIENMQAIARALLTTQEHPHAAR
jgi:ethanolamine utilization cobalamin adenosyltransferase